MPIIGKYTPAADRPTYTEEVGDYINYARQRKKEEAAAGPDRERRGQLNKVALETLLQSYSNQGNPIIDDSIRARVEDFDNKIKVILQRLERILDKLIEFDENPNAMIPWFQIETTMRDIKRCIPKGVLSIEELKEVKARLGITFVEDEIKKRRQVASGRKNDVRFAVRESRCEPQKRYTNRIRRNQS